MAEFTFFEKFAAAARQLSLQDRKDLYYAICEYAVNGEVGDADSFSLIVTALFSAFQYDIDSSITMHSRQEEKKGGRPRKDSNNQKTAVQNVRNKETAGHAGRNQKTAGQDGRKPKVKTSCENLMEKPKVKTSPVCLSVCNDSPDSNNLSSNEDSLEKEKYKKEKEGDQAVSCIAAARAVCGAAISALNAAAGSSYDPADESTLVDVRYWAALGHGAEDFEAVVAYKAAEWLDDPKMRRFLRPQTLFGPKFEGYLADARAAPKTDPKGRGGRYAVEGKGNGWINGEVIV